VSAAGAECASAGAAPSLWSGTLGVMATPAWPTLRKEDQWLTVAMEKEIRESKRSPGELRAKARRLRAQAEQTDIKGIRDASLALAAHYEQAAADRLVA
jgi:hypothetical protein